MPAAATRTGRRSGWPRRVVLVLCRIGLALGCLLALVRWTGWDDGTPLALLVPVLPYATAGAVLMLLTVVALRSWRPAAGAAVLVLVELCWLVPGFVPRGVAVPAGAPRLTVATVNTHVAGMDAAALVALVRREHVDVLAVEELTTTAVRDLDAAGLAALLPYREVHPEAGSGLYARLPLSDGGVLRRDTTWPQPTARVTVAGRVVRLVAVHTFYPLGDPGRWARDLAALRAELAADGPDTVLLGDFNATLDHAPMRRLLDAGLLDAAAELGHGRAPTWPADRAPLPPLLQLDHVLHGSGLAAVSTGAHTLPGTDHRAVVAELALLP
ncbi:endonuclease/exonuclease/phosphatase family protein [Kitasatospora nipponensis]|uniref:Endonuclease/exonuclease/phosphatase family protein n=1 Tax=Kitasatospora nipponensis TaxID=258049 RepID=A0ABP4HIC5_9ACTN